MKLLSLSLLMSAALPLAAADAPRDFGRVMFCGDSITHGVNDATYRWQLFKIFVDNGVKFTIVGPREGFSTPTIGTVDANVATGQPIIYRDVEFDNVHLAQSSGRTYNILTGSKEKGGVDYGGHSTKEVKQDDYNAKTYFCLMGTNDLISDKGTTPADFCRKMENLVGGSVKESKGKYTWTPGSTMGTMGEIVDDLLQEKDDVLYILTVPTWTRHCNNNEPSTHAAVEAYNGILRKWGAAMTKSGKKLRVIDINKGMVDPTVKDAFFSNDSFFTTPGRDGLHPNEQGSMLMAGNLAKGIKLPGRTAGLERGDIRDNTPEGRKKLTKLTLKPGESKEVMSGGAMGSAPVATLEFKAKVGNGAAGGWDPATEALTISFGDGTHAGTLRLSEGAILWGDKVLYCRDNSKPGNELIRVAYVLGNPAQRVATGYYVWLGDMLIGQGLPLDANASSGLNFRSDLPASLTDISYSPESFAPPAEKEKK